MSQPEIKLINTIEELKLYKNNWNKILKENENNNPFLEFDWILYWWMYFGKNYELFILYIKDKTKVLGFFPLMVRKKELYKEITFISSYIDASYMDFILIKEDRKNSIKIALDYLKKLKGNYVIKLFGFCGESANCEVLKGYLEDNKVHYRIYHFDCPYIKINREYETYFKERSKIFSSLKTLKRGKKKLNNAGTLTFNKLSSNQFEAMYRLHEKRWKKKLDLSKLMEKEHQRFYKNLALNNELSFKADVHGLMIGERLIGFTYGFECNGKYITYRIAHDDDFHSYGPGKIIMEEVIKKCFDNHLKIFDLGIGYARYKSEWTDDNEDVKEFVFSSNHMIPRLICLKHLLKKKLIAYLKNFKRYNSFKVYTLGKVKYLLIGGYLRDFKETLKTMKDTRKKVRVRDKITSLSRNIYSRWEYTIYKIDMYNKKQIEKEAYKNENSDHKENSLIYEVNLDQIDAVCEIMNKPIMEIAKRFYTMQRCFIYNDESKKRCIWVSTRGLTIPSINYTEDYDGNSKIKNAYILLEDEEILSNGMNTIEALNYFTNVLKNSKFSNSFIVTRDKNKELEDILMEIGYDSNQTIKYRKLFCKVNKMGEI